MQPLPKGVTGFDAPEKGVLVQKFTAACHAAMRQAGGRVQHVRSARDHVISSFHEALVIPRYSTDGIRVLCNAHYPIVAFATPAERDGDVRLEFIDCPEIADAMRSEFTVVSKAEACAGVADELVGHLSDDELHQMQYWKPQRIGDVVFNYWD